MSYSDAASTYRYELTTKIYQSGQRSRRRQFLKLSFDSKEEIDEPKKITGAETREGIRVTIMSDQP